MKHAEITKHSIEQGRGFTPKIRYFVDADGYSFGSFGCFDEAATRRAAVNSKLEKSTARDLYHNGATP